MTHMYSTVLVEVGSRKEIIHKWLTPSRLFFFLAVIFTLMLNSRNENKKYMLERFVKKNFKNISLYYTGTILDSTEENQDYLHKLLVSEVVLGLKITCTVVITVVILFMIYYFFILEVARCQGN